MTLGFAFTRDEVPGSAEKCVREGKLHTAIVEYEKIVKADPKDPPG